MIMLLDELIIDSPTTHQAITFLSPGDGDSFDEEEQDDWSDVDDEDFEDMAEDENDLHEIELENDIFDPEDDDHLPPEEDF
jgi:hypothetical protein